MARDRDDYDDRPSRRRDMDDAPPKKSNTGLILGIIAIVVVLPLLVCGGFMIYGYFAVKKGFEQLGEGVAANQTADQFLTSLTSGDSQAAYDGTTANFKTSIPKSKLDDLLAKNPVLKTSNTHAITGLPLPTGTPPNRRLVATFSVTPIGGGFDPDPDASSGAVSPAVSSGKASPAKSGSKPKPADTPAKETPKAVNCTVVVVEQPDNTWKVDGFSVP